MLDGFVLARIVGDFLFGFTTLFAIINPYGLAFVFLQRTVGLDEPERAAIARLVAAYAFAVLVVSLFAGSFVLGFFGISMPALRIAGGLVVAVAGWSMLHQPAGDPGGHASRGLDLAAVRPMAFFPLTIPLTTGPGTIAAAIALGANRSDELRGAVAGALASLLVAAAIALTIWHAYNRAGRMAQLFGDEGTRVVTRLSAFLLLCVGVQIMLTGVSDALVPMLSVPR
ncbi:MarC family protein [Falsiroseomonas oryziterrae]|uniref:MarC family protein n=1 Tax=Falsiroseomonas oryziterrae TaxID=2911368 RepID=UPI001F2DFF7B|nr:MarC family protein [Roseomonas sp. NPKOSM-4]